MEYAQALERFPEVVEAIAYTEVIFFGPMEPDTGETLWEYAMRPKENGEPISPVNALKIVQYTLNTEIRHPGRFVSFKKMKGIIEQSKHPQFLEYIKDRLGAGV